MGVIVWATFWVILAGALKKLVGVLPSNWLASGWNGSPSTELHANANYIRVSNWLQTLMPRALADCGRFSMTPAYTFSWVWVGACLADVRHTLRCQHQLKADIVQRSREYAMGILPWALWYVTVRYKALFSFPRYGAARQFAHPKLGTVLPLTCSPTCIGGDILKSQCLKVWRFEDAYRECLKVWNCIIGIFECLEVWNCTLGMLKRWKFDNRRFERFNVWKFESLKVWRFESLKVWRFESFLMHPPNPNPPHHPPTTRTLHTLHPQP